MIRSMLARILFAVLSLAVITCAAWAQNQNRMRGIPGYLDPLTGEFRTMMPPAQQDAEAPAASTFGGTLVFKFTITVSSTIASTTKIACEANALVSDSNGTYEEAAAVSVARGSGTTVSCTVNIPYSWALNTGSSDQVFMSYGISTATSSTTALVPQRVSGHSFPSIAVPANGATTTTTISATI